MFELAGLPVPHFNFIKGAPMGLGDYLRLTFFRDFLFVFHFQIHFLFLIKSLFLLWHEQSFDLFSFCPDSFFDVLVTLKYWRCLSLTHPAALVEFLTLSFLDHVLLFLVLNLSHLCLLFVVLDFLEEISLTVDIIYTFLGLFFFLLKLLEARLDGIFLMRL